VFLKVGIYFRILRYQREAPVDGVQHMGYSTMGLMKLEETIAFLPCSDTPTGKELPL